MYHISMKNWTHGMHMPKRHDMAVTFSHVFHDERFWAIVGAVVLFALLIGLAVLASRGGGPGPYHDPTRMFFPY